MEFTGVAVLATAKLPETVPDDEIVHVTAGLLAKVKDAFEEETVQLRELPVGNPPPEIVTGVPSKRTITRGHRVR